MQSCNKSVFMKMIMLCFIEIGFQAFSVPPPQIQLDINMTLGSDTCWTLSVSNDGIHTTNLLKIAELPWAKASCTSPPTPARESWGGYMWVWGDPAPTEREVNGLGREGEVWEEPAACAYETDLSALLQVTGVISDRLIGFVDYNRQLTSPQYIKSSADCLKKRENEMNATFTPVCVQHNQRWTYCLSLFLILQGHTVGNKSGNTKDGKGEVRNSQS